MILDKKLNRRLPQRSVWVGGYIWMQCNPSTQEYRGCTAYDNARNRAAVIVAADHHGRRDIIRDVDDLIKEHCGSQEDE